MFNSIRSRISPATVIATLALFAALGGGYATAFSGSGTVQKGALLGLTQDEFVTVRTLTGIGSIQASCEVNGAGVQTDLLVRFHNSSGKTLRVYIDGGQEDPLTEEVANGADEDVTSNFVDGDTIRYHIARADGVKTKQADVNVSLYGPTLSGPTMDAGCDDDLVSVLATNTEE